MGVQEGKGNQDREGATVQPRVPDESRVDVSVHGFWKWGTSTLFDMRIVNLDAASYLRQTSAEDLETAEKQKKENYLHSCMEHRKSFLFYYFLEASDIM